MVDDDIEEEFFDEDKGKSKAKKKSKKRKKNILSKKTVNKIKKNKTKVISSVIVIILAILALIYFGMPEMADDQIIAKVNGDSISMQELDEGYEMFFLITGYPEAYRQMITKENFLDQMINEELLLQEAIKLNVKVTDEEIEEIYNNILINSGITEAELSDQLKPAGFSLNDLKEYYKKQLMLTKLANETVFSNINISEEEIEEFYDNNLVMFEAQEGQIHVSHILVETRDDAKEILEELQKGADFKTLAIEKSIEPSAQFTGGDLGFFGKGQMVPEFENAAFALKIVGQLSGPIETQFGWHIIRKESDTVSLEEAEDQIEGMIINQKEQDMLRAYVDNLRNEAVIEIYLGEGETPGEGIFSELDNESEEGEIDVEIIEEVNCINNYGVSSDTIIFYYASWSPKSKAMIPIVDELSKEGYKFYMAEIETDNVEIIDDCFSDVISEHIPEFICAGSKSMTVGEMSKESLQKFADMCS